LIYRRLATPLHAVRPAVGCLYALALCLAAILSDNPIVLAGVGAAVVVAACGARVQGGVATAAKWSLILAIPLALINPLLVRDGLTVVARLGEWGPLGQVDVTLEGIVYGAVLGLRIVVLVAASSLFALTVDPDGLLRLLRRVSFRSALTAVLATRLVPVLAADGRRLADAQKCRADGGGSRLALVRAVATGALDRAVDVAATLEVRGYATAGRAGGRSSREPWSRHDLAFLASAVVVVTLALLGRYAGIAGATFYPETTVDAGVAPVAVAVAVVVAAGLPFLDRRGIA